MFIRFVALACAVPLIGVTAACSSPPPATPRLGTIPAGTADVTIDGRQLATKQAVDCTFIQSMTTIRTGDEARGTTTVIDNVGKLTARSIDLRDPSGFTGSYWQNLGGDATVGMTGRTFTITGTAEGFDADNPSARVTHPFSIKASC